MGIYDKYYKIFENENENVILQFELLFKFVCHIASEDDCKYLDDDINRFLTHLSLLNDMHRVVITTMIHDIKDLYEEIEYYERCLKLKQLIDDIKITYDIEIYEEVY